MVLSAFLLAVGLLPGFAVQGEGRAPLPPSRKVSAAGGAVQPGPAKVTVGAYINDLQDLKLESHSYSVDLYVWMRWRDPGLNPAASMEFVNPYEAWGHVRTFDYPEPLLLPGGELYQVVRVHGRFSRKLHLYDYPFDRQTLTIEFEDSKRGLSELQYVPDASPLAANSELELPGFSVGVPRFVVTAKSFPTAFGDTRQKRRDGFSRVRIEIPIARPLVPYGIKLLLPILCVIFCASLMFLFHPRYVDARVGIGITALLTIVALQITLNDELPDISYLVLMDKVYLGAYLFVIGGLGLVVRTTWMADSGDTDRAMAVERRALVVLALLYAASTAWLVLRSL